MERVVVFGGFDFVGYHLCEELVNEGIETILVEHRELTPLQMERFDTIGRNALLVRNKIDGKDSIEEKLVDPIDTIFFVYNPYSKSPSNKSKDKLEELKEAIKLNEVNGAKLILLSAINIDTESFRNYYQELEESIINQTGKANEEYRIIKVPYIYGPWCEDDCLIQKMIISKLQKQQLNYKLEYPHFLYITDLVRFLYQVGKEDIEEKYVHYLPNEADQLSKLHKWFGDLRNTPPEKKELLLGDSKSKIIKSESCINLVNGLKKTESYVKQKFNIKTD
jgi:UDP-glucose 4-epimerase